MALTVISGKAVNAAYTTSLLRIQSFLIRTPKHRYNLQASLLIRSFSSSPVVTDGPVTAAYLSHVKSGSKRYDEDQLKLASRLDLLHNELEKTDTRVLASKKLSTNLLSNQSNRGDLWKLTSAKILKRFFWLFQPTPPKGLYIHGPVGVGKSYLMDLFHKVCLQTKATRRRGLRRAHFHEFMLDVHGRIHGFKQKNPRKDPIPAVALQLAQEARLLCFDEFQVTDIADAMILKRLFEMLFDVGVVVVATSNRDPDALYEGGLNRLLFLPFLETFKQKLNVVAMSGEHDYRRGESEESALYPTHYFWPADNVKTRKALEDLFASGGGNSRYETLPVMMGRKVEVSRANDACGWFEFDMLCYQPLGAADYLSICERFRILILDHVPQLGGAKFNEARRFVTLIDAVYESKTKLIIASDVPLHELLVDFDTTVETHDGDEEIAVEGIKEEETMFVKGEGGSSSSAATTMIRTRDGEVEWSATGRIGVSLAQLSAVKDVSFSFRRAESRLAEMNRADWGR